MTDHISICVCTYKRPEITETLESLSKLNSIPDFKTEIIVVDNDAEPTAKMLVEAAALRFNIDVNYLHAPKHNISTARNACLDHAKGNLVAFIDDDEIVSPNWLIELYRTMRDENLQVVFGPVWVIYPDDTPEWIKRLDLHSKLLGSSRPVTGYTGNALMDIEHKAIRGRRFNPKRGRSGGEDTQFFFECYNDGAELGYTETAEITEKIGLERLSLTWMRKSKFRSGITYGDVTRSNESPLKCLWKSISSAMKVLLCLGVSLLTLPHRSTSVRFFMRGFFHAGVLASGFNAKEEAIYSQA